MAPGAYHNGVTAINGDVMTYGAVCIMAYRLRAYGVYRWRSQQWRMPSTNIIAVS